MNNASQSAIENSTQPARNHGVKRALNLAFAATNNWLRQQHEIALRRPPTATRHAPGERNACLRQLPCKPPRHLNRLDTLSRLDTRVTTYLPSSSSGG